MTVKVDADGRRSIQVEAEFDATPEQVWRAIATGPGVSSWFVPTDVEEREGGKIVSHFGPGMDSEATITRWDAPRSFAAESSGWPPGAPPLATEWYVEARDGGRCLVRVVHSLFASTDDWDGQLEGTENGWPGFFRVLGIYLAHFDGEPCAPMQVLGVASGSESEAWERLAGPLGLSAARAGERLDAGADAPPLVGTVEHVDARPHNALLRLDAPAPGVAAIGAHACGGDAVQLMICCYFYGAGAADVVAREEPRWQAWLAERFPAPNSASGSGA